MGEESPHYNRVKKGTSCPSENRGFKKAAHGMWLDSCSPDLG